MANAVSSQTQLQGGNFGLDETQGAHSMINIVWTKLTDGMAVNVSYPAGSTSPTLQWTGQTANTSGGGTRCTVDLTEQLTSRPSYDDPVTVSVTVGGTALPNWSTFKGVAMQMSRPETPA